MIGSSIKLTFGRTYCPRLAVPLSLSILIQNFRGKKCNQWYAHYHASLWFPSLPPAVTGGLLCFRGSDKLRQCWRRCVRIQPVTDLWLSVSTTRNDEAFWLLYVPTCTRLYQLRHLVAQQQPPCSSSRAAATGALEEELSSHSLSCLHAPVTVVTAIHPGSLKKPRIRVAFFHQKPSEVKVRNIWVC